MRKSLLFFIFCLIQFLNINVDNNTCCEKFNEILYNINNYSFINDSSSVLNNISIKSEFNTKSKELINETLNFILENLELLDDNYTIDNNIINAGLNLVKLNVEPICIEFLFDIFIEPPEISFFSEAIFDSGLSSDDMGIEDYCIII